VLTGRVEAGQVIGFRDQAQQALEDARKHDGLIYAQVGRQVRSDGGEEVIFVSVWRDLEALYQWLGGTDLLHTRVRQSGSSDVFEHFEVQHYEAYETAGAASLEAGESEAAALASSVGG